MRPNDYDHGTDNPAPSHGLTDLARDSALLLSLVRRVIETGRGPQALVRWVKQAMAQRPATTSPEMLARELTLQLSDELSRPARSLAETVRG